MKFSKIIMIAFFLLLVACSNGDKPIEQNQIIGKWNVSNDQVDINKFLTKYGQINVLEGNVVVSVIIKAGLYSEQRLGGIFNEKC